MVSPPSWTVTKEAYEEQRKGRDGLDSWGLTHRVALGLAPEGKGCEEGQVLAFLVQFCSTFLL